MRIDSFRVFESKVDNLLSIDDIKDYFTDFTDDDYKISIDKTGYFNIVTKETIDVPKAGFDHYKSYIKLHYNGHRHDSIDKMISDLDLLKRVTNMFSKMCDVEVFDIDIDFGKNSSVILFYYIERIENVEQLEENKSMFLSLIKKTCRSISTNNSWSVNSLNFRYEGSELIIECEPKSDSNPRGLNSRQIRSLVDKLMKYNWTSYRFKVSIQKSVIRLYDVFVKPHNHWESLE